MPDDIAADELTLTSATETGTAAAVNDDEDDDDDDRDVGSDDEGDDDVRYAVAVVLLCATTVAGIFTGTNSPLGDSTITWM